jgi:hypothetical protein
MLCAAAFWSCLANGVSAAPPSGLDYRVKVESILQHDDGKFLWYHPRATRVSTGELRNRGDVLLTLQKHLHVSDYYSGLHVMRTSDAGQTWQVPHEVPELAWVRRPDDTVDAVCDVTPGWHAATKRVLLIGAQVRYSPQGEQLNEPRANQTAYAVYDPATNTWSPWRVLELPTDAKFDFACAGCAQWIEQSDGTLLIPMYVGKNAREPWNVVVAQCSFDGQKLKYQEHGDEFAVPEVRGLAEPSLIRYGDRYYLTIRHDLRAYVTVGNDGLHFGELQPWQFDDGAELSSYNTQQHWLAHSDGLFLVYTRRGANNDHIERHRAPLFMAQVDPEQLCVLRATERVLIAERGAELGNFGAAAINARESWVTVSEGVWSDAARQRGAKGATFVARILWAKPNQLVKP